MYICGHVCKSALASYMYNVLSPHVSCPSQFPDPRELQMNITGFLNGKNARLFMQELWDLLTSAQNTVGGIPARFLEQKKEELRQKKVEWVGGREEGKEEEGGRGAEEGNVGLEGNRWNGREE